MRRIGYALAAAAVAAGAPSCAHIADLPSGSASSTPSATPSGGSTATPAVCATSAPANATVIIAMSNGIAATSDATYGSVSGYGNASSGTVPATASVIRATTSDVIVFVNIDQYTPSAIIHSAAGFAGSAFPPLPYTFAPAAASPIGSAISTTAAWSTGRIAPANAQGSPCYSTTFTASQAGTYFFGDFDYYNLNLMRDVLIVTAPAN